MVCNQGNQMNLQTSTYLNQSGYTSFNFIKGAYKNVTGEKVIETQLGVSEDEDEIQLGEDTTSAPGFGSIWYGGNKPIGGDNSFCVDGRCLFQDGIRVFFTLDNSGEGEGFIFSLIAAGDDGTGNPVNTRDSAGGDYQGSELLGYAGDSRVNNTPQFLDGSGEGLKPPKMGLEFDTRTQYDQVFNLQRDYCDSANLKAGTRNDPRPNDSDQDAAQFVFWGSEDPPHSLELSSCRADSPNKASYDDNRHDAEDFHLKWTFATAGEVKSSPAVGADGTIYVGSNDHNVYALDAATGNKIWNFPTNGEVYSTPAVVDGFVYVGSRDKNLYALDASTGNEIWRYETSNSVYSSPAVVNGVVYINSYDTAYALDALTGNERWNFFAWGPVYSSSAVVNGRVYFGASNTVYALDAANGRKIWNYTTGNRVESSPAVANNVVYIGSNDYNVYALDVATGNKIWNYTTGSEVNGSPTVANDIVYIGSKDSNIYALNAATGNKIWSYKTGNWVESTPSIANGILYIGSNDAKVYAFG